MGKRKRRRSAGSGRRGRPGKLASVATSDLQAELDRRRAQLSSLERQREDVVRTLNELDREIKALGGSAGAPARRGPGRPPGSGKKRSTTKKGRSKKVRRRRRGRGGGLSLADTLHQVLTGRTLSVTDATQAVQDAGYPSKSPNLRTMVNQQLLANTDRFKKVARGQYTAR